MFNAIMCFQTSAAVVETQSNDQRYLDPPFGVSNFSPRVCFWWLRGANFRPLEYSGRLILIIIYWSAWTSWTVGHILIPSDVFSINSAPTRQVDPNSGEVRNSPCFSMFFGEVLWLYHFCIFRNGATCDMFVAKHEWSWPHRPQKRNQA